MPSSRNDHVPVGSVPVDARPVFQPIFGKVVIKIEKEPERKWGNLILPQREVGRSTMGTVHAVYEPTETPEGFIEPQVKVGDTVLFGQFTGTMLTIGRELFVVCREHDLLTVVHFGSEELPRIEEIVE